MGDFWFFEWWAGLSRGFRFGSSLLLIGLGALFFYTNTLGFYAPVLLITGAVLFIASIELRNDA